MKRKKLNVIIQAIACGTISLNLTPHLHGQQFDGTFQDMSGQVLDSYAPVQTPGLTEMEIPGSSYYVGPDGERLTDLQQYQGSADLGMPQAAEQPSGETILSEAPIYDGKNVYPMGTFPSQEFGERIISETIVDENGKTVEVPGTLEGGAAIAEGDGMENGIPVDQVVQPNIGALATDEVQPPVPEGDAEKFSSSSDVAPGSVVVPNGDASEGEANAESGASAELKTMQSQLEKLNTRHDRLKDRLSEANRSIEKLTQEKQKAEKVAKDSVASMGEMLAGIENRSRAAREASEGKAKAEALAKTKADAKENELKKELADTKQLLTSANKKLAQPKPVDKAAANKLAALLTAKATADAGLAKLQKDSNAATSKLKKQISGLKSQLKRAETKVNEKKGRSAKTILRLEKDLKSAKANAEMADKSLTEAKKAAGEAEKAMASKVKGMDSKLHEMESSMKETLDAKEKEVKSAKSKAEKTEKALAEANKAAGEAEKTLSSKTKAMDSKLHEMESSMEEKLVEKEKTIADKEKAITKMVEAVKRVVESKVEMREELKASQIRLQTLKKEMEQKVASAMEENGNLQSDLEQATKEATAANAAAADSKAALAKLQMDSQALTAKLADQAGALSMLKSDLLPQGDAEMKSVDPSGTTGIAATPDQSPEPAVGSAPKIEITSADDQADSERDKRDAAMAEVKRKLAEGEAEKKAQQAAKEAEMKAIADQEAELKKQQEAKEAEMKAAAEMKQQQEAKEAQMKAAAEQEAAKIKARDAAKAAQGMKSSLSLSELEDQIKILKARRDSLIIQAETKIREKQEAEIDKMIADGKAADSVEVTAALEELNNSIHSSNEKLTARYRRKIEKLKKAFKANENK